MLPKLKVLFLCTGNACRSQMAEGWARAIAGDRLEAWSAGVAPAPRIDPRAIDVMREAGIDIALQHPKPIAELEGIPFDLVVTVCDTANERCPVFPGTTARMHHAFDDPPRLAAGASSEAEALAPYRRVRDEIRSFIETFPVPVERQVAR